MEALGNRSARGAAVTVLTAALLALAPQGAGARANGVTPKDPAFAAQWQLNSNRAMGIRAAWRVTTGGDAVVAVLDTGARLDHPDLAPNLWTNPGELPGNGIDDDGNGVADDVHGYDFADGDADPADDHGHGTHVAGVIGARGDNRTGMTGVAWRTRLMIVRVLGADGTGSVSDVADGIRYAVANGARVINLSLAGPETTAALEAAIADAHAQGAVVVASAGNEGADLDAAPAYPAASDRGAVVAVAATGATGALEEDSSFGARTVDLAAPGESIDGPSHRGGYEARTGTSQAAAQVSGTLALMLAAKPTATADELRAALVTGARPGGLPVAYGRLHAGGALKRLLGRPLARVVRASSVPRPRLRARASGVPRLSIA